MSLHLKRTVLFFCVFYLGLGVCFGNPAVAKDPWKIFISGIHNNADVNALKRKVSGWVFFENSNNFFPNVGIYDGSRLLAVTTYDGYYFAEILAGVKYTLIPKKEGYSFSPVSVEVPANDNGYQQDFVGHQSSGLPTPLSPSGTIYSSTPTFKWVFGSIKATFYILDVYDVNSTTIFWRYYYKDTEAGCSSGSANCSVTPPTWLADKNYYWTIRACLDTNFSTCGEYSSKMNFIVNAGADDPDIVGLWKFPDQSSVKVEQKSGAGFDYVGKMVTLTAQQTRLGFKVGEEVWWLKKDQAGRFSGKVAWRDSSGAYWKADWTVWIKGNNMLDGPAGKVIGTKG